MKLNTGARTNWDLTLDNKPTSDVPRIKFSYAYSKEYLNKVNSILEIGCGTGSYTQLAEMRGYIAIDIDISAVKVAHKHCPNSEFIVASATDLPFKDQSFDLVCVWGVFEELPAGAETGLVAETRRVLRNGSFFLLSAYTNNLFCRLLDPAHITRGVRHYNVNTLLKLIADTGFSVVDSTVRGGSYTVISNFLVYFYKHILHKKSGNLKKIIDKKSDIELNSKEKEGIVYIYISARKACA